MLIYKLAAAAVLLGSSLTSWALPQDESLAYAEAYGDGHFHDQWSLKLEDWVGRHGKEEAHEEPPSHPPHPPVPDFPHDPHHRPNIENKTIFQALQDDDRFSRLFKIVNFTETIAAALNDTKSSVTFFAVPDKALKPPPKHHGPPHGEHSPPEDLQWEALYERASNPQSDLFEDIPLLEAFVDAHQLDKNHSGDDDKKKEIFKAIVTAILSYHILPEYLTVDDLSKNSTFATSLTINDGSLDGNAQRIRVLTYPRVIQPLLIVNFRSKIIVPDVKAKNGIVHVINNPVFPPASAFQSLFLLQDLFSTFTSAIQRVGLSDAIEWRRVPGKDGEKSTVQGSPSNTVFVPTNKAFKKLPAKLQFYLFSPFGEHVLKKLLQFHIVPEFILHSDWTHNATESVTEIFADLDAQEALQYIKTNDFDDHRAKGLFHCHHSDKRDKMSRGDWTDSPEPKRAFHHVHGFPHPEIVYSKNLTLPTLLTNHTLYVNILQFEHQGHLPHQKPSYWTKVVAHGVPVSFADGVVRNGAVHLIDKVLNPRKANDDHPHHHRHHGPHPPPPPPPPPGAPHRDHPLPPPPPPPPGPPPHGLPHGHPPPPPPGPHGPPPPPSGPPGHHGPPPPFPPGPHDFVHSHFHHGPHGFDEYLQVEDDGWNGWEEWLLEWANEN